MKRNDTGNPSNFSQKKSGDSLWNGPVGMNQIKFSLLCNPKRPKDLRKNEKGKLCTSQGIFLHVL